MATTFTRQSVTVSEVLDGLHTLLRKILGFSERLVIRWLGDTRPILDATVDHLVWYRWTERKPDQDSGAGRYGHKTDFMIEVNLCTRLFEDSSMRDARLIAAHITQYYLLENGLYNRMLFDDYLDPVGEEPPQPTLVARANGPLTIGTMIGPTLPKPDRSRPEQGYVESRIELAIPTVLRLTLNEPAPRAPRTVVATR